MSKNKVMGLIVGLIVLIFAGGSAFFSAKKSAYRVGTSASSASGAAQQQSVTENSGSSASNANTNAAPSAKSYTLKEIGVHKDSSSCWTAVNGRVYDLTPWISQHPGGDGAILSMCGLDGSAAFDNQHGGQGKPERVLASYEIGTLVQ